MREGLNLNVSKIVRQRFTPRRYHKPSVLLEVIFFSTSARYSYNIYIYALDAAVGRAGISNIS